MEEDKWWMDEQREYDILLQITHMPFSPWKEPTTDTIIVAKQAHADIIIAEHRKRHSDDTDSYVYTVNFSPWYYLDGRLICPGCDYAVCPFNVIGG